MQPCRSWTLPRVLCAALLALPLLAGVTADAPGPIGTPIVQPPLAPGDDATADGGGAPAANTTAPAANTTAPAANTTAPAPGPVAAVGSTDTSDTALPEEDAPEPGGDEAAAPEGEALEPDEVAEGDVEEDDEPQLDAVEDEADDDSQNFGGRREVDLPTPTLVDAFALSGELIAVKHLSRFEERLCSSSLSCDSAFVAAMMVIVSACGAFIITHASTFLPDTRPRAERNGMQAVDTLSSTNTATTVHSSLFRPPSGDQYRWPLFLHFYRSRSGHKDSIRIGHSIILWVPALFWAAIAFSTSFIVTPAQTDVVLESPVAIGVTDAAQWGAVRFDGCNDVMWHVDDELSPISLRRTIRRCYDARRIARLELPSSQLLPPGDTASMLITSDHVRFAVLYENGQSSTISRVSARVVDLSEEQPAALDVLRGGAGGGRTDAYGMFLTSRFRLEALTPYYEAAMRQPAYRECGPPRFQYLGDDGSTFSGRWTFSCSPQRGAELGVDGLLLAVLMRHTEYRFDVRRANEAFEVFVPVRGIDDINGEVIEVMRWPDGLLIGHVGTIWCNWMCSVIVAAGAIAVAAVVGAVAACFSKGLPLC